MDYNMDEPLFRYNHIDYQTDILHDITSNYR